MPHFGQSPGTSDSTPGHIGQKNFAAADGVTSPWPCPPWLQQECASAGLVSGAGVFASQQDVGFGVSQHECAESSLFESGGAGEVRRAWSAAFAGKLVPTRSNVSAALSVESLAGIRHVWYREVKKTILHEMLHSPFCIPIAQMLRAAGVAYESREVPNWDRSELLRLTGGAYYAVPAAPAWRAACF